MIRCFWYTSSHKLLCLVVSVVAAAAAPLLCILGRCVEVAVSASGGSGRPLLSALFYMVILHGPFAILVHRFKLPLSRLSNSCHASVTAQQISHPASILLLLYFSILFFIYFLFFS